MTTIRRTGRWTPADRVESTYQYVPIDVPPGTTGLTVELSYDASAGILDLGCLGPEGFRGWSGGARERFAITPTAATPGYLPGPLTSGTWRIMMGLVRVDAGGVRWALTVTLGPATVEPPRTSPPVPERPPARDLPAPAGWRWLAGDLHTHTVHSDGALTVAELAAMATERGLDYLAVTDHNTISHHPCLAPTSDRYGITLVPGQEVTTGTGHANVFGAIGWIDFREPAEAWLTAAQERGALMSVNHPVAGDVCWLQPMRRRPPLAEIWHWSWLDRRWGGPIAWWRAWGYHVTPVGGSDWHRPGSDAPPGSPTTWVCCPADARGPDAVLDALRAGRTAVSAGTDGPVLVRVDDELVALAAPGAVLVGPDGRRSLVVGDRAVLPAGAGPYLLTDGAGAVLALCY